MASVGDAERIASYRGAGASQAIEPARMTVPGYVIGVALEAVERYRADAALAVGQL